jgi:hypothetical protein
MNAEIRIDGDSVPTKIDGVFFANMPFMLNLVTDFGEMDLTFTPAGRAGGVRRMASWRNTRDNQ